MVIVDRVCRLSTRTAQDPLDTEPQERTHQGHGTVHDDLDNNPASNVGEQPWIDSMEGACSAWAGWHLLTLRGWLAAGGQKGHVSWEQLALCAVPSGSLA
jgi:hypothetical protein